MQSVRKSNRAKVGAFIRYTLLIIVGIFMLYPLIWMVFSTFKPNSEIFGAYKLLPVNWTFQAYLDIGISYGGQINLLTAMKNTWSPSPGS